MAEIYTYDRTLQNLIKRFDNLEVDADPIKKWYIYLKTDKNESLSPPRIIKMLGNIIQCSDWCKTRFNKRIVSINKDEVTNLIIEINDSKRAPLTKRDYRIAIKKFMIFAGRGDDVAWIKTSTSSKESKRKLPADLLTEDEVNLLVSKSQNSRDKALLALLADSGLRIGEALSMRIKDIFFDEYGAFIIIPEGKTGSRRVRLISSIHYLKNWIENHPKPERDNQLFVTLDKHAEQLNYGAVRRLLTKLTHAAGLKKRVHAHLFRHTAATRAAGFMTEADMKIHFGWDAGSDSPSVYIHRSGEQVDNKLLNHYGLKKIEENGKDTLIKCPKCSKLNPKTTKFCGNCSCILSEMLMTETDNVHQMLQKVKEYLFQSQEFGQLLQKAMTAGKG
jgi:integrase